MSKPMFFYAGIYDNANDADTDLRAIKALNDSGAIGSYDAELITKKPNGEVKVTKTEKPTEHGAWWGVAAGAATVVLFPVAARRCWSRVPPAAALGSHTSPTARAAVRPRTSARC